LLEWSEHQPGGELVPAEKAARCSFMEEHLRNLADHVALPSDSAASRLKMEVARDFQEAFGVSPSEVEHFVHSTCKEKVPRDSRDLFDAAFLASEARLSLAALRASQE